MKTGRYHRLLGRRPEREVNEDLEIHFEMLVEDYIARGMTPEEAGNAAFVRMGNLAAVRDEGAAVQKRLAMKESLVATWYSLAQDAHFALRMLGRQKSWAALSVITLGLGLGANSAMFSIVNAAVLRPLPFPQSDRIMSVSTATNGAGPCRTPKANSVFYGIAAATDGLTPITAAQFEAIVRLCAAVALCEGWSRESISQRIVGHDAEAIWTRDSTRDSSLWGKLGRKSDPTGIRRDRRPIIDVVAVTSRIGVHL